MSNNKLLEAALKYAALGFRVFPLAPGTKLPRKDSKGFYDGTTDAAVVERWWRETPRANIGIWTFGLVVIDVDGQKNPWLEDVERFETMLAAPAQMTANGGFHFIFRQPEGTSWKSSASVIAPNVDTKADDGYILITPSELFGGRSYRWLESRELFALVDLPKPKGWLLDELSTLGERKKPSNGVIYSAGPIPHGERNETLASIAGTMRRHGLSEVAILEALKVTNQERCQPPIADREVAKIAKSISRYEPDQMASIAADGTTIRFAAETEDPKRIAPGAFPHDLLSVPGLIGEVIQYDLATAPSPQPVLALGAAIALMSVLTGRKIMDAKHTQTNVYVVGLCESGGGKEHPRKINKIVLEQAGCGQLAGPESFASHAGLLSAIDEQRSCLFQLDEIGRMLKTMNDPRSPHLYGIITTLMRLFSCAGTTFKGDAYADKKKNKAILWPHCVLFATTPAESFYESMTREALRDGFIGRILVMHVDGEPPEESDNEFAAPPEHILDSVRAWHEFEPGGNLASEFPQPTVLEYSKDAQRVLAELKHSCADEYKRCGADGKALWRRVVEKACKLAILWQASADGPAVAVVSEAAALWGARLCTYLTQRLIYEADDTVAETPVERLVQKILRRVREKASVGLAHNQVTRHFQAHSKAHRDDAVRTLVEGGRVVIVSRSTGKPGPQTQVLVATEHFDAAREISRTLG